MHQRPGLQRDKPDPIPAFQDSLKLGTLKRRQICAKKCFTWDFGRGVLSKIAAWRRSGVRGWCPGGLASPDSVSVAR